jgi:hypothetical protein
VQVDFQHRVFLIALGRALLAQPHDLSHHLDVEADRLRLEILVANVAVTALLPHLIKRLVDDGGINLAGVKLVMEMQVELDALRRGMEELGFRLEPETRIRAGLFRADFSSAKPDREPLWITWVDAAGPKPDFHVAESFGEIVLRPSNQRIRIEK